MIEFSGTFQISYGRASSGTGPRNIVAVTHDHHTDVFEHREDARTRTVFSDGGEYLPEPRIYAPSQQAAIGEAVKVATDRAFARLYQQV